MIISISGKINHGKDTVGNIIHYLLDKNKYQKDIPFNPNIDYSQGFSGFQTKKFADKLKDIACMLIGCTREQLEDQEFKKTVLSDKWKFYTENGDSHTYTVREFLQKLGTDAMRDVIHENVWVNALMCDYKAPRCGDYGNCLCGSGTFSDGTKGLAMCETKYPNWIITDTRFPNELEAVKQHEGITIRVERLMGKIIKSNIEHLSETSLDSSTFDATINNNGTIEDLVEEVRKVLIKFNII